MRLAALKSWCVEPTTIYLQLKAWLCLNHRRKYVARFKITACGTNYWRCFGDKENGDKRHRAADNKGSD